MMSRSLVTGIRSILCLLLLFLFATAARFAVAAESGGCRAIGVPVSEVPFTLIGDHIYTEATVNGTGPYRFIVDTGGVNLIDISLVKQLSLRITGREAGHGIGPETVETGKTTIDQLALGKLAFSRQLFYTFDFGQLYAGGGVKMMGMVGAPLFRQYVTCIDFHHNVIDLLDPSKFDPRRAGSSIAMSVKESSITVDGSFDGIPGVFQIDTGSATTVALASPFVAEHQLLKRFPTHVEGSSGGVGGRIREYTVRGKDLVLGAERIPHPITSLAIVSKGQLARSDISGNIGIGALKRYVVTFDFRGKRLFRKSYEPPPADLDSYDRSGMRIEADPEGFRVVSVSQGTPAAEAGLLPGDLIVEVDGQPAGSIDLPAMRDELRKRPEGAVIFLSVKTQDQTRRVRLKLRNLL